jgi:hypothetical protein
MSKKKENTWYATFNKSANLIWGYGKSKKEALKEAKKLYKQCEDNDDVGTEKEELYKTVEVREDVLDYMENIKDDLTGCLRLSTYYNDRKPYSVFRVVLTEEAEGLLRAFKERQEEIADFRKDFEKM